MFLAFFQLLSSSVTALTLESGWNFAVSLSFFLEVGIVCWTFAVTRGVKVGS